MDAEQAGNDCPGCANLQREEQGLREQVVRLAAALEGVRARGKRQAVPFSKGLPGEQHKRPGR